MSGLHDGSGDSDTPQAVTAAPVDYQDLIARLRAKITYGTGQAWDDWDLDRCVVDVRGRLISDAASALAALLEERERRRVARDDALSSARGKPTHPTAALNSSQRAGERDG